MSKYTIIFFTRKISNLNIKSIYDEIPQFYLNISYNFIHLLRKIYIIKLIFFIKKKMDFLLFTVYFGVFLIFFNAEILTSFYPSVAEN